MTRSLIDVLVPSPGRRDLLVSVLVSGAEGSASELGRRARLSPRAAQKLLREFLDAGLVTCEGIGMALVYRDAKSLASRTLSRFLREALAATSEAPDDEVDAALTFHGAPLLRSPGRPTLALEEAVARGAKRARRDSTLFRTLPVVLARNATLLDWSALRDAARAANSKAEVGLLLDLTGEMLGRRDLSGRAREFKDGRRKKMEDFFEPQNRFEKMLARERTPAIAKRWHFWLNMDMESLRSTLDRHGSIPFL